MKSSNGIFIFFFFITFCQCKKVIQVNLNNASPQIIISGEVTNNPGPYQVSISQSVNFSSDNIFPPISGAIVTITDSNKAITDSLTETSAGLYSTHFLQGTPGDTYQLSVTLSGMTYKATSVMPQPVSLDSVTFILGRGFNNKSINPVVNFQDPPLVTNYYQFTETVEGRLIKNIFILNDRLSDGKYIRQPLFNDSSYIQPGNIVSVGMYCIEKNIYTYFDELQNATGNGFQSVAPSNPASNINNGALGYFSAHTQENVEAVAN